jgi:hypothetical protein
MASGSGSKRWKVTRGSSRTCLVVGLAVMGGGPRAGKEQVCVVDGTEHWRSPPSQARSGRVAGGWSTSTGPVG